MDWHTICDWDWETYGNATTMLTKLEQQFLVKAQFNWLPTNCHLSALSYQKQSKCTSCEKIKNMFHLLQCPAATEARTWLATGLQWSRFTAPLQGQAVLTTLIDYLFDLPKHREHQTNFAFFAIFPKPWTTLPSSNPDAITCWLSALGRPLVWAMYQIWKQQNHIQHHHIEKGK